MIESADRGSSASERDVRRRPEHAATPNARRDTGITASGARERHRIRRARVRAQRLRIAGLLAAIVVALSVGWTISGPNSAESRQGTHVGPLLPQQGAVPVASADPTPMFATYRSLHLYLPVAPEDLTELAFHQASGDAAQHLTSLLPDADMATAAVERTTGRVLASASDTSSAPDVLPGAVLRMWRSNRSGPPDTAADVGGKPGTTVLSPVSGRVVEVRPYLLYGEHEDIEIHIQPAGWPELDLVLIHVTEPTVRTGDEVVGGVTPVAQVRLLSDRVFPQLGQYVKDGGDHVHVQLNKVEVPGKLEVIGGS